MARYVGDQGEYYEYNFFHLDTILLCYYYNAVVDFFHGHKEIDDLTALEV